MTPGTGWAMPWPGAEIARQAEQAGAQAFCAGEFVNRNAYVSLAEMAATTTTAMVGTGVAYAFARSPFVHASAVRHVDALAPGRVFLGLGSGTRRMNESWFAAPADRALGRMADMVGAIRAYLTAENMQPIIGHGLFTDRWWDETIDPNLAEGATAAVRDPDDSAAGAG